MGPDVAGPELVAAVANAGGIGLLAPPVVWIIINIILKYKATSDSLLWLSWLQNNYEMTVKAIKETKKLTNKPFGAGILLEFENSNTIRAIYDEKLPVMEVYWGDFPKEMVDDAHRHGVKVIHQVASVEAAERAIAAGVDCIIAQGVEAGGHIAGTVCFFPCFLRTFTIGIC